MATSWKKIKNNKYEILYINKKEDTLVQIVNNSRLLGWYVSVFKSKSGCLKKRGVQNLLYPVQEKFLVLSVEIC